MSTPKQVITRFAPSPTGYLHIGGARTALYNYLFAKHHGGKFILRVEDTDVERSTPEAITAILDGMVWLGLNWDEGPHYQTKRFDLYNEYIDKLVAENKAYPCFCNESDLSAKREQAVSNKIKYRYDRTCFNLSSAEKSQKLASNTPHCIRFISDDDEEIIINDLIKGKITIQSSELDDLIIRRTDGHPTYNFCVVIDDATMNVSHVIRGDDHINNTPRQIQLYKALGFELPTFAHCSMILGEDKKKLSKRHGATSVILYKDMGYLPQAIKNYLVRLGWSHGDQEIFSMQELEQLFDVKDVNSSASTFNTSKLQWLNQHYIKASNPQDLMPLVKEILERRDCQSIDDARLTKAISLSLEKVKTLVEMADYLEFLFKDISADEDVVKKVITDDAKKILYRVVEEFTKLSADAFENQETMHAVFESLMQEFQLGMGKIANPVRVALSGKKTSPGAFDLLSLFGKESSLNKIKLYL